MKKLPILFVAFFVLFATVIHGQVCSPIATTGYNIDAIAETAPNSLATTTQVLDWSNHVMYSQAFSTGAGFGCGGVINSGTIVSGTRTYQLQPFTANNCLFIATGNTATLTLTTPAQYTFVSLLLFSTEGGGNITVTFNYTNLTSTSFGSSFISDWFFAAGAVYSGFGRCTRVTTGSTYDGCPTDPRFYPLDFTLSCADQQKSLKSITITTTSGNQGTYIMALSGHLYNQVNTVSPIVNVSCNGGNNGSAALSVTGGTSPFTYSWNTLPVQTTATATNLTAGTYTCTITDANGCQTTATATITQPPALATTFTQTNVTCNAACNGSATVTPTGGTGAYTYSWSPSGGTAATASSLCAGTYSCTVHDANNCVITRVVTITQPTALTASTTQTNVTCNAACNGSATVTPSGGTGAYTFSWSPSGGTAATASSLCAGTYTCTIQDANNCVITKVVTITQPTALAVTSTQTNVTCNAACNGTATVTPTGGTGAYTYSWSPSGGTAATASSLCAGTYTCTIHDANNCVITKVVTITQPVALATTFTQTNVTCNAACNGTATVTPTGGTTPYTYSWSPSGGTAATASALCAGTYTCTVHDANNCVITQVVTITQPAALATTFSQTNVTCNAACNGTATVTPTGGTGAYTYSWSPSGGTAATALALCAGTYTCTVHDANNCVITQVVTITQPPALTTTFTQTNVTCNPTCNGTATVTPAGGTGAYTYSWSPSGGTGATASSLCAGTYTCTIHDANNCVITQVVTITQPPVLAATSTSTGSTCGNANGSVTATPTGGTAPYTYSWSPGGSTTATTTGLLAGTYTCTVTDAHGCTVTTVTIITNAGGPVVTIPSSVNVSCNGGSNGSANSSVSGGTAPYTYSWTPSGGTGANATGLAAGTYTLTVHDANGCLSTATITITQPPALAVTFTQTNVTCNAACNGTATVTPTGGTGAYTYSWSPSGGTAATASALCAGTYTCTIHDANNCVITQVVTITQPPALAVTFTQVNVTCNAACNGSSTVTVTGGTGAYTYSWTPSGGTAATASSLCAGTYTCTIHDANNCVITQVVTITQPTALTATSTSTGSTCGNANGSVTATPAGGTPGYTYSWSPGGQTTATVSGELAGTYTCTITDAHGCTVTTTTTVTNAGGPVVSIASSVNVSCFGGNNGSANTSITGGTAPYTYSWTPSGGTGANATGLAAGTYTVTVHDANGCVTSTTVTITQPAALTATIPTSTNVSCNGGSNGTATAAPAGGTSTYTYSWSPTGGTGITGTGMSAGTYTVTVTDAHGCTTTATIVITQPTPLTATNTHTNVSCNGGSNGSATVTASGATPAYTYSWSPSGGTSATASGLAAGTYTCTITDAHGCNITSTVIISQPTPLTATSTNIGSTCGNANGSVTATPTGGTAPYTYSWSPGGSTTATTASLPAGTYTCTVTDANGCTTTTATTIVNAGSPTASISASTNVSCFGGANGSATVSATGGTTPYTYSWSPSGGTAATASGLAAGTYTVTVTDNNGCSTTAVVTITQPTALAVTIPSFTNVSCFGGSNGTATSAPTGGTSPYTYSWSPAGGTGITGTGMSAGTYTVTVTDAHGCSINATIVITQPTQLTATNTQVNVSCNGGNDGTATVTASGATPAYTYSWSPSGGTAATATGLSAGAYTCTITDANGCNITSTVTITQPTPLTATSTNVGSTCGNPNGSVTAVGAGGTGPYTYSWSPSGGSSATATGLAAGTYTCTVTDAHGCTTTTTTTILNAGSPTASISSSTNVSCFGGNNGSAAGTATGGTAPYTYSWSPAGGTAASASGLTAGTYTLTVTDANGCQSATTVTITEPTVLAVTIPSSTNVSCFGGSNGTATSAPTGGTSPYTYSWSPAGGTGITGTGMSAGTYTVTVTDAHGCTTTATIAITQPTQLTATNSQTNVSCNSGSNGTATVVAANATPAYTYSWNTVPAQTTATATNLAIGTYTCTITDANGCSITSSVTITQPTALVLTMSQISSHCNQPDGSGTVAVTGGTGTYTYSWSPSSQTTPTATGFAPGTYSVTVHDANGCVATNSVVVGNVPGVTLANTTTTNVSCFGGTNGSDVVTASSGTAPYTYSWSTTPVQTTATATGLAAGSYICTATDSAGCISSVNVTINQPTQLTVAPMNHVTICISNCTPLTATGSGGTAPYTYSWTNGAGPVTSPVCPTVTTTYTVVATDANGCVSAPGMVTVTVNPPLTVTAAGMASVCPGASTPLSATASGGNGSYNYSWIPAAGLSSTSIANPTATPAVTTTYTVIATDNCGTPADSATVTVTIYPTPIPQITSPDTAGCAPWTITFNGSSNPNCASASWLFGDGGTATGCGTQTHTYLNAGSYNVTLNVTDIHGCTGSIVMPNWITIYPVPEAAFTASPQPATIINSDITFTNLSTGATSYSWNFGDLSNASSTLMNPHYTYPDTGCFTVTLLAKNSFGCSDTATLPVCIAPDFTFFAPNAFTPDGDGKNDVWMPQGVGIDPNNFALFMFDRWGNLIWYTDVWGKGWDGRANNGNDIAQIDSYVWKVKLKDFHGNSHEYTGVCNLIK